MEAREAVPAAGRSTFVTVVAWIFIVLSGFATLMSLLQNIVVSAVMPFDGMPPGEAPEGMPPFMVFMFSHMRLLLLAFLLVCAASLAAAIGLLRRKEWARLAFIAMLVVGIAWNLGGLVLQYWVLSPVMMAPADAPPEFREQFDRMAFTMLAVTGAFALGFTVLFGWIIRKLVSAPIRNEFRAS